MRFVVTLLGLSLAGVLVGGCQGCSKPPATTVVSWKVTVTGAHLGTSPASPVTVSDGQTLSLVVTAEARYHPDQTVGGDCPAGSWSGSTYVTGAIVADCTVLLTASRDTFTVNASATHATLGADAGQVVASGAVASFPVEADPGYLLQAVSGTCPAGGWSDAGSYSTGPIAADCSVIFTADVIRLMVGLEVSHASASPDGGQLVDYGSTASYSVTHDPLWTVDALGSCPAGTWTGSTYTTGPLFADCTQQFVGSPIVVGPEGPLSILVERFHSTPTVTFEATANGTSVPLSWSADRPDAASLDAGTPGSGTLVPTGTASGVVTVSASDGVGTLSRQVLITLTQNGPVTPDEQQQVATTVAQLSKGGGMGGVGGEGLGAVVSDPATLAALSAPVGNGSAQNLTFLYPYEGTVFPRGILAPLLQWSSSLADADAVRLELSTASGSFSWIGTFARPAILGPSGKFVRHPIPQDIWAMATETATSTAQRLTVKLTVAKAGMAYGPISQTWTIAPGLFSGRVHFTSYNTGLLKNSSDFDQSSQQYGAGVLALSRGLTSPTVTAGTNTPVGDGSGCRVCHTVSADGHRVIAQRGDNYNASSAYDLRAGNAETKLTAQLPLAGQSSDGALVLTSAADLGAYSPASRLYAWGGLATPLTISGLPVNLQAGAPAFSFDGKHVAFDFIAGTIGTTAGNGKQLVALDYEAATNTFLNFRVLATVSGNQRAGYPSFMPTDDAVVYHHQIVPSNLRYNTWHGSTAQIWWSDLATGSDRPLLALNGLRPDGGVALPTTALHPNDTVLNFEPSASPIAFGGYAWVVFTSRRLYGNVATNDPYKSDPRDYDGHSLALATTKKLWVAAIDLDADGGVDPSHPAFYLPGQELLAANSRGLWAFEPCQADGLSCGTGDQCCGGYCSNSGTCASTPAAGCAAVQERCASAADCCAATNLCLNGLCVQAPAH